MKEEKYYAQKMKQLEVKKDRLEDTILGMEKEVNKLQECKMNHDRTIQWMEESLAIRLHRIQNQGIDESKVKSYQGYKNNMFTYLHGSRVQQILQLRRETNRTLQQAIYQVHEDIRKLKSEVYTFENQIVYLQGELRKVQG